MNRRILYPKRTPKKRISKKRTTTKRTTTKRTTTKRTTTKQTTTKRTTIQRTTTKRTITQRTTIKRTKNKQINNKPMSIKKDNRFLERRRYQQFKIPDRIPATETTKQGLSRRVRPKPFSPQILTFEAGDTILFR
jgi:hypothetical protein